MLVTNCDFSCIPNDPMVRTYAIGIGITVSIYGFLYNKNGESEEQISHSFPQLIRNPENYDFISLLGNYIVFICNSNNNTVICFGDNSGMLKPYISKNICSNSFLEISKTASDKSLNYDGIVEWLHFKAIYGNKTLLKGVTRLERGNYFISRRNSYCVKTKNLPRLEFPPDNPYGINKLFDAFSLATSGLNIALDITGGLDSRLILSQLESRNCKYQLYISGAPDHPDTTIGQEIASILKKEHNLVQHKNVPYTSNLIESLVNISDGQVDALWFPRISNYLNVMKQNGIELNLSGIGGEGHKDSHWVQDFPFLNQKVSHILRYYNLRMKGIQYPHNILSERILDRSKLIDESMLEELSKYVLSSNTKTYDNIYFNFICQAYGSMNLSARAKTLPCYAPLMEFELLRNSFSLPRYSRIFSNQHRKHITSSCKKVSTLKTTSGATANSGYFYRLRDLPSFIIYSLQRGLKVLARRYFSLSIFSDPASETRFENRLQDEANFHDIITTLKKHNILPRSTHSNDIPTRCLGSLVSLSFILKGIDDETD